MSKTIHRIYISTFVILGLLVLITFAVYGYNYYKLPLEERFYHKLDETLKPSGYYGHGFGIVGSFMMIFGVASYMIRKRIRLFSRLGILKYWLEFHIFLCSVGPIFILYHTAFKFGGIVALSFWSMVIVVFSGIVGRYIYIQIPRTIQGNEIGLSELQKINQELSYKLLNDYSIDYTIVRRIEDFLEKEEYASWCGNKMIFLFLKKIKENNKFLREIKISLKQQELPKKIIKPAIKLIKQKIIFSRRIGLLKYMQKIFKYWHIAHLPFAFIMIVIMIIHVIVAITFGYKWIY